MNTENLPTSCTRQKILQDVEVLIDLSGMVWPRYYKTKEQYAKELDGAAKELEDFLRDHRSQDRIGLDVRRKYLDICSACQSEWEEDVVEGKKYCANCGAMVEDEKHYANSL